jgi:hypothetical protein
MRVSRWSPSFKPEAHSPCLPVWVGFPMLRAHLQTPTALQSIAFALGKVLKLHDNVINFTRPGMAMVCVEIDFSKEIRRTITIQNGDETTVQPVQYPELIPAFCLHCGHFGHASELCSKNPGQLRRGTPTEDTTE